MKEFEIEKEDGYFIGPSPIGRNKEMSLRAKGLMYVFFTLPPEWDYSINGLVSICQEGRDVIKNTLNELKRFGYIEINPVRDDKGHFGYKYTIHRKSLLEDTINKNLPKTELPLTVPPKTVNPQQLNNNKLKDKKDKTKLENFEHSIFTKELIKYEFIEEDEKSSFLFDDLFEEYLEAGYSTKEIMMSIHYIVPRIIDRNFMDENGNKILNKYTYFKTSLESNFNKLNNLSKDLYSDEEIDKTLKEIGEL